MSRLRIAVVGQVPPPHHGQALGIQTLLEGAYSGIDLLHVPMRFSSEIDDVGRLRLGKVAELVRVVARIWHARWMQGARVLYYPPAGPNRVPILRDIAILLTCRWMFDATVFHFHAGGLSHAAEHLPRLVRPLFWAAYGRPTVSIRPSALAPDDGRFLGARHDRVVPYGVTTPASGDAAPPDDERPTILFVGAVRESKGVEVLVEACARLHARGLPFRASIVGRPVSAEYRAHVDALVASRGLDGVVRLEGELTGAAKWEAYRAASLFCFPTHYEAETFGLVVAEAMSFGLPCVVSDWSGVPSVVDEACAVVVPPHSPEHVADALERLLESPALRASMGRAARERYARHFTVATYHAGLDQAFQLVRPAAARPLHRVAAPSEAPATRHPDSAPATHA